MARNEDLKSTPNPDDRLTPVWAGFTRPDDESLSVVDSPYIYEEEIIVSPFEETLFNIISQQLIDDPDIKAKVKIKRVRSPKEAKLKTRNGFNKIRISSSFSVSQMREIMGVAKKDIPSDGRTYNALTRDQHEAYTKAVQEEIAKEKEKLAITPNSDIG